jgi:hypothetical protein
MARARRADRQQSLFGWLGGSLELKDGVKLRVHGKRWGRYHPVVASMNIPPQGHYPPPSCDGPGYLIAVGSAKLIAARSAKVIAAGSAKLVAFVPE